MRDPLRNESFDAPPAYADANLGITKRSRPGHDLMQMPKAAAQENHRKMAAEANAVTPRIAKPRHIATPGAMPGPEALRRKK